jgi:hypothetical protein
LRRVNLYIGDKNSGETARRNAGRTDNAFTIRDEDDATILDAASVDGARDANPSTLPQLSFAYRQLHSNSAAIALLYLGAGQPEQ